MTQDEVIEMLGVLKTAYPQFYKGMGEKQGNATVALWSKMFANDNKDIVNCAVLELIQTHSGFPPDIASVKNKMKEICQSATGEATDEELWQILKRAVSNGGYGAKDEFDKLPPILKRYCGSPATLYEFSQIDVDTFNTVTHGQFLKQIGAIKQREEFSNSLSPEIKNLISGVYKPIAKTEYLSLQEINDRRNKILDDLDLLESKNN